MLKRVTLILVGMGMLLHFYIAFFESSDGVDSFSLKLMVWSWLPYLICLALLLFKKNPTIVLGGATPLLVMDSVNYYGVFIHPTSSTASLSLLFIPLWNLVFFMPVGMLSVLGAIKLGERIKRKGDNVNVYNNK